MTKTCKRGHEYIVAGENHGCRTCARERSRAKYRNSPEAAAARAAYLKRWHSRNTTTDKRRDTAYRRRYGISLAEYEAMVNARSNRCDICGEPPTGIGPSARLHVDHDHATGRVRGLLCTGCNVAVGQIEHELYEKRLAYLRRWEGTQ